MRNLNRDFRKKVDVTEGRKAMRPSFLLALSFFSAQIDHAQAANDHRIGCGRFFYQQDLSNSKRDERRGVWGAQQVAQASSRTGGYDLYPGGQSPGGLAVPGGMPARRYAPAVGGAYPGGVNPGGAYTGGMYPGGTYPGGSRPGGAYPTGGPSALPGGLPRR